MLAGYVGNYSRYEIERKFLLEKLPSILPEHYVDIHDIYLSNSSLRLRIERSPSGDVIGRKLTKKDRAPKKGKETNIITSLYLTESDLTSLGELSGASLIKRRFTLENESRRIVYDVFQDHLEGLIMAEVEFKNHESKLRFKPQCSSWQEVTGNPNYSGGSLAFSGIQELKT